jgi:hypothetical protein
MQNARSINLILFVEKFRAGVDVISDDKFLNPIPEQRFFQITDSPYENGDAALYPMFGNRRSSVGRNWTC